jgi:hypothetical protein
VISPLAFVTVFAAIYALAGIAECLNRLYRAKSLEAVRRDFRAILLRNLVIVSVMMIASLFYLWMRWSLGDQN